MIATRPIREKLLRWYDRNGRDLPWRRTRDPYAIWVSEVMLQQTQVKTVVGRYAEFLRRFPSASDLARAPEAEVLHAWQGLGYYSRARRLQQAARAVVARHGGRLPPSRDSLLLLPGVGAYSAGAVASIAFGERVPVVDGNVVRVLTRLFALRGDPGRAPLRSRLWSVASELVPEKRPGDFNQALMELGATLCTPQKPACERCPVARECRARALGNATRFPELPARERATDVRVAAAVVRRDRRVLVVREPDGAPRWAGLFVFPFVTLEADESAAKGAERATRECNVRATVGERLATFKYTITRYRMTLEVFEAKAKAAPGRGKSPTGRFHALGELERLAMPAPHRKLATLLRERES